MEAQAELMSLSISVNDDMKVTMRALEKENTELKDQAGKSNRLFHIARLKKVKVILQSLYNLRDKVWLASCLWNRTSSTCN
jgi:hypothetical protein